MSNKDVFILNWKDYKIEVTYVKSKYRSFEKSYGYGMSHIEIYCVKPDRAPLPITNTGYRSIFIAQPQLEELGGVETMLINALDDAAKKKSWKEIEANARQYCLF